MRKVNWGVLGAGGIADRRTMPGMMLAGNARIRSVMEIDPDVSENLRAKYGADKAFTNARDLLSDPGTEAVYIASPVVFHKEQAMMAADYGKHILLEKPIALTVGEGQEVIEYCKRKGVLLATGFMMRFHAYHVAMKRLVEEGKLGQIVSCRAQLTCWYPDIPGSWRQSFASSGGGALMDMGVHCLDLIQHITGSRAKRAAGMAKTLTFGYEVEDSGALLVELENGALCHIEANFNIPDAAARGRLEIYGTKGSMLAEGTISQAEGGKLEVMLSDDTLGYDAAQDRNRVEPIDVKVEFGNMYTKEIESFSNSIINKTDIEVPAEDAVQVQRVIQSAYRTSSEERYERF
ncbi:MAG: Gfo/Idh/MocA family oxidoreductase [Clostridia bacterium]|nr:Gfo/Idh/MocA family oxidoreductase [Clostridia bacterium]